MKRGVPAIIFMLLLAVIAGGGVLSPVESTKTGATGTVGQAGIIVSAADPSTLIAQGKSLLSAHDILDARNTFRQAVAADPTNQEANLLYGVTRIFAVYEDGQTVNTTGLDSVREIMELSGVVFSSFNLYNTRYTEPHSFADATPRTGAVLDFLNSKLLPEINGAIANLAMVTNPSFSSVINPSTINKGTGAAITVDYADALVISSFLQAMKCNLELLMVYGLDASLPSIQAAPKQLMTYKKLFQDTTFLTPKNASSLATAKTALVAFIDTYNAAAESLKSRSGAGHHLFVVDVPVTNEVTSVTSLRLDKIRSDLADLKTGLNGIYLLPVKKMNDQDRFIDLSKFFNSASPINIRSQIVNCGSKLVLPDPTLGGLFPLGLSASASNKPGIAGDILGVACTGQETPLIKFEPGSIWISDYYGPRPRPLTISNNGTANLVVSAVSLVGLNSSEFNFSPGNCSSLPATLTPGSSCTAQVDLNNPQHNYLSADIQFDTNDVSSPHSYVHLTGYTTSGVNQLPGTLTLTYAPSPSGTGSGSIEFSVNSYSISYSDSCPGACSRQIETGGDIKIRPIPSPGSVFASWSGCDSAEDDKCKVKMYAAKTVNATFNRDTTPLTVMAYPPSGAYAGPQSVKLAASKAAAIYYTLDNSTPSAASLRYTGPFSITAPATLKYIAIDPFNANSGVKTETYTALQQNATLTVTMNGNGGGGTINSILPVSGLIICSAPSQTGDICSTILPTGTVVALSASEDSTSLFSGWSLASCPGAGNCLITLDANTSVTGNFTAMPPVELWSDSIITHYTQFQDAYKSASTNSVILLTDSTTFGALLAGNPVSFTIMGGFDAGFNSQSGYSVMQGKLTIGLGDATIERLIVK